MMPDLTDVDTIKHLLAKREIRMSRGLGQHFLICREVVEALAEVARAAGDRVVELGPGLGVLTQALLASGLEVRAIEKDDDFVELLPTTIPTKWRERLELVHGDLRDKPWTPSSGDSYQVVGNIPYQVTGWIVRRLTQLDPAPEQAILLTQREVGERMRAKAGKMNLLALAVALWGKAELLLQVPPHCFWPQPEVASQLLLLTPSRDIPVAEREAVMAVARAAFQQKRKQLQASLRKELGVSAEVVQQALGAADIDEAQRPEELAPEQWRELARHLPTK